MKYTIDRKEKYMIFVAHEKKIDSSLSPNLKSEMLTQHSRGVRRIILDLSEVQYMDSSGLSALLVGNRVFQQEGGMFVLVGLSEHVMKLIKISQLDTLLYILPTTAEAIIAVDKYLAK